MANLFKKVSIILFDRPTVFLSYLRQTYLFYQTKILLSFLIKNKRNVTIENNVRFQSLKNLLIEKNANFFIGKNSIVYENARIEALGNGQVSIGQNSIIGDANITSRSEIRIGSHFITSWNVYISDFDAHPINPAERKLQMEFMTTNFYPSFNQVDSRVQYTNQFKTESIVIGDNVWVGANVTILKGAKIGNNCIVATGSIVLKGEYPHNSVIAGNPAKVVKSL